MPPEIRHPVVSEAADFLRSVNTAYLEPESKDAGRAEFWLEHIRPDLDRTWGAFDRGRAVGSLRSLDFQLTVPGGRTLPADGISMVSVAATHRRRGLLTGMIAADLAAAADRGDTASILMASEWRIYGRYGFGPATEAAEWRVDKLRAGPQSPRGELEYVSAAELRPLAPPVFDRIRLQRAGGLDRPEPRWDRELGLVRMEGGEPDWDGRAVVHRDPAGEVDGYLRYSSTWGGLENTLTIDELVAATDSAYADLWRFALSVDLITHVVARRRPMDEPLPWLLADGRFAQQTDRYDKLWVRLLDVPAALTARDYLAAGRVVLEFVDKAGYAAGRFELDAGPEGATCRPTTANADLTLPVAALGSAYLGGHRLAGLAVAGLVDEHTPGTLRTADRLLLTDRAPWATLNF
ncbi:MAG TPA: GNAT family N-acetyltransferase [Mycobacteriales bacterium]|nr:GNAT family N-acetyltransferase [Mycobacteriales bacterium]